MPLKWKELGPAPADLAEARLVLHQAVQLVAAVGQSLAKTAADDSQQSLSLGDGTWLGVAAGKVRAGLEPEGLVLFLADADGKPKAKFPLAGRTLQEGLQVLEAGLNAKLTLPKHPAGDFPHHAIADGARFPSSGESSRAYLAKLFSNTQSTLGSRETTMWPHHFDLACTVGKVSAGFSPGDGEDGLPYWYATFNPPLKKAPAIAGGGRWRTSGWPGADLQLEQRATPEEENVKAFFQSAFAAA
ncbi:MAG TPA: hypothetical protein VH083_01010 [Myxococcales bacterium]|nr:hypothetical protein [Myxococcales bacterium]